MENQIRNSSGKTPFKKPKEDPARLGRYMGAGFQLIGPVAFGVILGQIMDHHFDFKTPIFTLSLAIIMLVLGLYLFIKEFIK